MKIKILLLFLISLNLPVCTQNYQTINPEWIYYFEPARIHVTFFTKELRYNFYGKQKYIKGVRVDSISEENGFKEYLLANELHIDEEHLGWGCSHLYFLPGTGWLGNKVIVDDQFNIFINDIGDSIFIKTDAGLQDSWTIYESNNFTMKAELIKIDTISFLNVQDSAKFIEIKTYDTNQTLLNIKTLQDTLILSRNHGFIQLYNFKYFPDTNSIDPALFRYNLVGIPEKDLGISNLTNEEVFDYEIGDEFHYHHSETPPCDGYSISTCIDKSYSGSNDSLIFTFRRILKRTCNPPDYNVSIDTFIIAYPLLNKPATGINKLPLEDTGPPSIPLEPYHFYLFFRGFNGKLEVDYFNRIDMPMDGCPVWCHDKYIAGIGKLKRWSLFSGPGLYNVWDILLYYKKGEEEWGTPITMEIGIDVHAKRITGLIYPNPTTGKVHINLDLSKKPGTYTVMNSSGIIVYKKSSDFITSEIIDLEGHSPGIYFLTITYEDEIVWDKFILIK